MAARSYTAAVPPRSSSRSRALLVVLLLALGMGSTAFFLSGRGRGNDASSQESEGDPGRVFESNDAIERGCALGGEILGRLWRGYVPGRSFELLFVPQRPNYVGAFDYWGHSGPWDYLQNVPLVLYGPRIESLGRVPDAADPTDIYATVDELLDADLPPRRGTPLSEAIVDGKPGVPRLIATVVLDGVGRNVLRRWPGAWPHLKRLEEEGTSYVNAMLESSPSLTPATHATMATGAFPRKHRIPSIQMRRDDGSMTTANRGRDPRDIEMTTFADEYDLARNNRPLVGLLGWSAWHLGLLGHGKQLAGGDADHLGILLGRGRVVGNNDFYSTPTYLPGERNLEEHARDLDRSDGEVDDKWMGHRVLAGHVNPAWVYWQRDAVRRLLRREGYGSDRVPDLFFTNYKIADIAGHRFSMSSREMRAVIAAEDDALASLVRYLKREVKDYVLIVTADHGHTPPSEETGSWPIDFLELDDDLQAHFGLSEDQSITEKATAAGFYLDNRARRDAGITKDKITEFVNSYTIAENWDGDLPEAFVERGDEHVFSAAFMDSDFPEIMECAFGSTTPPPEP